MDYLNSATPIILFIVTAACGYLNKQLGTSRANERELYTQIALLKVVNAEEKGETKAELARLDERSKYAKYNS